MEQIKCHKCKNTFNIDEGYLYKHSQKNSRRFTCKPCMRQVAEKYKRQPMSEAAKENKRRRQREWSRERSKARKTVNQIRGRCRENNISFDLDVNFIKHLFDQTTHCPIFKMPFSEDPSSPLYPNIDRIYPSSGYIKENVWVISARANRIKSDATYDEIQMILDNWPKI